VRIFPQRARPLSSRVAAANIRGTSRGVRFSAGPRDQPQEQTKRALDRLARALCKAGSGPLDAPRRRVLRSELDKAERELRQAEIAERRRLARSQLSRPQLDSSANISARQRREAAREERRESARHQQAARDAAKVIRSLRGTLTIRPASGSLDVGDSDCPSTLRSRPSHPTSPPTSKRS